MVLTLKISMKASKVSSTRGSLGDKGILKYLEFISTDDRWFWHLQCIDNTANVGIHFSLGIITENVWRMNYAENVER